VRNGSVTWEKRSCSKKFAKSSPTQVCYQSNERKQDFAIGPLASRPHKEKGINGSVIRDYEPLLRRSLNSAKYCRASACTSSASACLPMLMKNGPIRKISAIVGRLRPWAMSHSL
jgi:hypothetical protein